MNKVPLIKPTLMGKKTIFKTDTIPTKGSNNIVTSDALAQALQDKVVNKEEEGEKTIVPTGDIIIGKLLEDGFYILDPTFLGTKLIKVETPTPGKLYYDRTTHIYYTFQGNISEDNVGIVGYKFEPLVLPSIVKVTWQELKDLRDNSKLIPGLKYHITDYQCTTTQKNTRSAGHQFDIILLALSKNKLAEEGWAMEHPTDVYDVTFADDVTKKCWIYDDGNAWNIVDKETLLGSNVISGVGEGEDVVIDEENKTGTCAYQSSILNTENLPYSYFQNSNLSAWKVWYCLDNDKSRFAWADDSEDFSIPNTIKVSNKSYIRNANSDRTYNNNQYYAWSMGVNSIYYTLSENPEINDVIYQWQIDLLGHGSYTMRQQTEKVTAVTSGHEGRAKEAIIAYYNNELHNNLSFKRDTTTNNGVIIDNGITYYTWVQEDNLNNNVYTLSEYPEVGDLLYHYFQPLGSPRQLQQFAEVSSYQPPIHYYKGRGVIYRLIDEWNNDVPYDFKNIQYVQNEDIFYAFSNEADFSDYSLNGNVKDNRCFLNGEPELFMPYYMNASEQHAMCISNIFLGASVKDIVHGDTFCNIYKDGNLVTQ